MNPFSHAMAIEEAPEPGCTFRADNPALATPEIVAPWAPPMRDIDRIRAENRARYLVRGER